MAAYCTLADLHAFGLPRGAIANPGRLAGSVDTTANAIGLDAHGFSEGDPVQVRSEETGDLPSPLSAGVEYYAIPLDSFRFQLAASPGGPAIDFATGGSQVIVIAESPVNEALFWASRLIDDSLPAHVVPLSSPYPEVVVMTAAELAAGKLASRSGASSQSLGAIVDAAQTRLARWAKGVPIRGDNAPTPAGLAVSVSRSRSDPTGWGRYGGIS